MIFRQFHNIIAVLFCGIFTAVSCYAQAEYTDLYKDYFKINENAKSIKEAKIKSAIEINIKGEQADTVRYTEYDRDGNITRNIAKTDTSQDRSGQYLYTNYTYIYKEGRLTEKIDSSSKDVKKHFITYGDLGDITGEEIKSGTVLVKEIEYEYDNLSRLTEATTTDKISKCKIIITYDYDSYNNLAKKTVKNECLGTKEKPVNITFNYKYDNKYRIIEKQAIYPNAGYKVISYQYGPKGEVISQYESAGSDTYDNIKYIYDDKTNSVKIEKTETTGDLNKISTGTILNDKSGNRLEEKYFDSNGKLIFEIKNIYQYY